MICSSGIGFDPVLDGRRLTFGFHGIYQGTAVLYDRQTDSLWFHFTGECVEGELEGRLLTPLGGAQHIRWGAWRALHPDTDVMKPDPAFMDRYWTRREARSGFAFFPPDFPSTIQDVDDRLAPAALLRGVTVGTSTRAYPHALLRRTGGVANDLLADVPVVVFYREDLDASAAYERVVAGGTLTFRAVDDEAFEDEESGSRWNVEGLCLRGHHEGEQLRPVASIQAEWYGWYAHNPETTVWDP